jgi:hypothetical protein
MLDRFRRAGPPGPPAPAAVPADRRTRLLDEVAPIFTALAPATAEARDLVAAARAADLVEREAELNRRRLRALEHHRIPALRAALSDAVAQVEELEAADAVLRRWAAEQR